MTALYGRVRETRNPDAALRALSPGRPPSDDPSARQEDRGATGALIAWDPDDLPGALERLLAAHPERFSGRDALPASPVPFRMHLLDAEIPPAILLHPQPEHALAGYLREQTRGVPLTAGNRNYKDRYAKFEVAVALTRLRVLSGQRSVEELRALSREVDLPWLKAVLTFRHETPIHAVLRMNGTEVARALRETRTVVAAVPETTEGMIADTAAVVRQLDNQFPGDRGILLAVCMNLIELEPGQAMVTPAGCLHTYLSGQVMVVMSISDNALKAGLTTGYVDVAELQQILSAGQPGPAPLPVVRVDEWQESIPLWNEDLHLRRVVVDDGAAKIPLERFTVVLAALGEARITVGDVTTDMEQGSSILYLGEATTAEIIGPAQLFIASRS